MLKRVSHPGGAEKTFSHPILPPPSIFSTLIAQIIPLPSSRMTGRREGLGVGG